MTDLRSGTSRPLTLESKFTDPDGVVVCSGVQALVRVVLDQLRRDRETGMKVAGFASGYPGSPLGGFDREVQRQQALARELGLVHVPGQNEELAATSVTGTQLVDTFSDATVDGVLGVWYGKAPGLDRSLDAIRHAQFIGTAPRGGVLAFVGDDPASKSSTIPSASELTLKSIDVPTLEPATVQDVIELGAHGASLSRATGLWCAFRVTTSVADAVASVDLGATAGVTPVLPMVDFEGGPYTPRVKREITGSVTLRTEREILDARVDLARAYASANQLDRITVDAPDAWLGLVSRGAVYQRLMGALGRLGLDEHDLSALGIRVLQLRMINPVDHDIVRRFAEGLDTIMVVEEKREFVEVVLRDVLYHLPQRPSVIGRNDEQGRILVPASATLDEAEIAEPLRSVLLRRIGQERLRPPTPARTRIPVLDSSRPGYYCSGCPHNVSTKVPDGSLVGGGIGCHSMASWMDESRYGEFAVKCQMGGEGAGWIGVEPFVETDHMFQNIGDGTFFHSGQLAVQAAVAAGSHITFKLLWNDAIAMTGGQSPKSSNARSVPDVAVILLRQGVSRVIVTADQPDRYRGVKLPSGAEVWDRARLIEAQEVLRDTDGVTVLIHDQRCAAEKRRDIKRGRLPAPTTRIAINERVCEGCGDCGVKSNCLSVEPVDTDLGRKTRINQSSCNTDYTCLDGDCPAFITIVGGSGPQERELPAPPRLEDLPEIPRQNGDRTSIRMPGIGGTGVVTVNQVLATGAILDGREVTGLDQTGLSQKAGPVVSSLVVGSGSDSGIVDAVLGFDLMVAVEPSNLEGLVAGRSRALVSTSRTPTGEMVSHVEAAYPDEERMRVAVEEAVGAEHVEWIDALGLAERLLGDTATSNILMLGAGVQLGLVPVAPEAIEEAIGLNGVAVDANLAAFRWGRQWAVDSQHVEALAAATTSSPSPELSRPDHVVAVPPTITGEVGRLAERRAQDLIDYQDRAYAERYLADVAVVAEKERIVCGDVGALSDAAARFLYKLMAYKDEYEVARLLLDEAELAKIEETFGTGSVATFQLHPPMLRTLGLERKIGFGPKSRPILALLARGKRLRGTRVDPFGYASMRRTERALIEEYRSALLEAVESLTSDRLEATIRLAKLPDVVRGYEEVKSGNVDRFRQQLREICAELGLAGRV